MLLYVLVAIYFVGAIIALFQAISAYYALQSVNKTTCHAVTGGVTPAWFLLIRVLFWPYYVLRFHSPLSYISELFFKHYGDAGASYIGTQGIMNLYHDLFHKNYYCRLTAGKKLLPLNKDNILYKRAVETNILQTGKDAYAVLTYAYDNKKYYFLMINIASSYHQYDNKKPTRYELYCCEKMTKEKFIASLDNIHTGLGQEYIEKLATKY